MIRPLKNSKLSDSKDMTQDESKELNGSHTQPNGKLPVSFAAAAAAPEVAKDVAVVA
jgi:hypothetical protein